VPAAPIPRPKRVQSDGSALLDPKKGIVPLTVRNLPRILTIVSWLIGVAAIVAMLWAFSR